MLLPRGGLHLVPSQPRLSFPLLPVRPEHDSDDTRVETDENGVERAHEPGGDGRNEGDHGGDVDIWSPSCNKVDDDAREDADDWDADVS